MQLINQSELKFGKTGAFASLLSRSLMKLLLLDKINNLYGTTNGTGSDYASGLLKKLNIDYNIYCGSLANIPVSGGVVIVANHPTGALDGILLLSVLSTVRPDVKFMGNYLLERIEPMKDHFICVDPFDGADPVKNRRGIKQSLEHLHSGGALVVFAAGEVATWQKGFCNVADKPWSKSVMKFIHRVKMPIVPIRIEASNSTMFHLAGKVHPMLRTAMLPRELINKRGQTVGLAIGSATSVSKMSKLSAEQLSDAVRANVECLKSVKGQAKKLQPQSMDSLIQPVDRQVLVDELSAIRDKHLLFAVGDFEIYFAPYDLLPNCIREIGRLREMTFRAVGEGTMKGLDIDKYDTYYHQLFMWDRANRQIAGGYRMGLGDEIIPKYGLEGFYTDSLFKYDDQMAPIMLKTIELGRSFIVGDYQRKPASLMLLWKGIVYVLLKYTQYRNLLGPVTISGEFSARSKALIVDFLQQNHIDKEFSQFVTPQTGLDGISSDVDFDAIIKLDSMYLINKLVLDMEPSHMAIPILIKKYLQLNSHVLGFNVDHEFCDALDALMLLDLKRVPDSTILMLSKEITEIDVIARFKKLHIK